MRLICPNCGAQYEVEDSVIPDDGRDVQCSNCGHTWFQQPAHKDRDLAEELGHQLDAEEQDTAESAEVDDSTDDAPASKPARERRGLDPDVTGVLREEAAREAAARRGEGETIETQPDLGLDDPGDRAASRSAAARARMARLRGGDDTSPEAVAAALAAASASRRDLLPDIDEINSSLRASEDRETGGTGVTEVVEPVEEPKQRSGGFRRGFVLVVLLAVLAVAIYVMAPRIIGLVPQSEPFLIDYVAFVNELRAGAAEGAAKAVTKIKELIAGVTGG